MQLKRYTVTLYSNVTGQPSKYHTKTLSGALEFIEGYNYYEIYDKYEQITLSGLIKK